MPVETPLWQDATKAHSGPLHCSANVVQDPKSMDERTRKIYGKTKDIKSVTHAEHAKFAESCRAIANAFRVFSKKYALALPHLRSESSSGSASESTESSKDAVRGNRDIMCWLFERWLPAEMEKKGCANSDGPETAIGMAPNQKVGVNKLVILVERFVKKNFVLECVQRAEHFGWREAYLLRSANFVLDEVQEDAALGSALLLVLSEVAAARVAADTSGNAASSAALQGWAHRLMAHDCTAVANYYAEPRAVSVVSDLYGSAPDEGVQVLDVHGARQLFVGPAWRGMSASYACSEVSSRELELDEVNDLFQCSSAPWHQQTLLALGLFHLQSFMQCEEANSNKKVRVCILSRGGSGLRLLHQLETELVKERRVRGSSPTVMVDYVELGGEAVLRACQKYMGPLGARLSTLAAEAEEKSSDASGDEQSVLHVRATGDATVIFREDSIEYDLILEDCPSSDDDAAPVIDLNLLLGELCEDGRGALLSASRADVQLIGDVQTVHFCESGVETSTPVVLVAQQGPALRRFHALDSAAWTATSNGVIVDTSSCSVAAAAQTLNLTQAQAQAHDVFRVENFMSKLEVLCLTDKCERDLDDEKMRRCVELRDAGKREVGDYTTDAWKVLYLQADARWENDEFLAELEAKVRSDERLLAYVESIYGPSGREGLANGEDGAGWSMRVAEYHRQIAPSGGIADPRHYDMDSLLTVDIMLSGKDAFTGGRFSCLEEVDGGEEKTVEKNLEGLGTMAAFPSHKFHCVSRVETGTRRVLVLEFWTYGKRHCACRDTCLLPSNGPTEASTESSKVEADGDEDEAEEVQGEANKASNSKNKKKKKKNKGPTQTAAASSKKEAAEKVKETEIPKTMLAALPLRLGSVSEEEGIRLLQWVKA